MDKSWDFHENMHNNAYDKNHDKLRVEETKKIRLKSETFHTLK